jgi:hypothetical protein
MSTYTDLSEIEDALVDAAARLAAARPRHRERRLAVAAGLGLVLVIGSAALSGVAGAGPLAGELHRDTVRPEVFFSLRPPHPGARRLEVSIGASEPVRVRLLVTQVGHRAPLLRRTVNFRENDPRARSLPLAGLVEHGLLIVSGIARDDAGNATQLPQCVIDAASGQGRCTVP